MQKLIFFKNVMLQKSVLIWLAIIFVISIVNLVMALALFRNSFAEGDVATFYQFATYLSQGEVIYKDFIHFRTPGSYFLQSFFLTLFGPEPSSLTFALQFEAHVLFIAIFGVALAILFKLRHHLVGAVTLLAISFLPSYLQLRTALAFLAVVLYIQAKRSIGRTRLWLILSGITAGLTFTFGQEAFVMVLLTIVAGELITLSKKNIRQTLKTIVHFALGFVVGVAPLLIYVIINGTIGSFLYYTLYYAFLLQPKGMDVDYPILSYETILYFIVPLIVVIAAFVNMMQKKVRIGVTLLIVFAIARLVTLFGRSDLGHMIFVLPEIILLCLVTLSTLHTTTFSKERLLRVVPFVILIIAGLVVAIYVSNIGLIIAAFGAAISYRFIPNSKFKEKIVNSFESYVRYTSYGVVAIIAVFFFLLYPLFHSQLKSYSFSPIGQTNIGGVSVSSGFYKTMTDVKAEVEKINPKTIFSYPIQPYYYVFANKHAARYLTFEPQTTIKEQEDTIRDLMASKPEVIIFDPAQATDMSQSLYLISRYITENYQIKSVITGERILWIMVPGNGSEKVVFSLYRDNLRNNGIGSIQSPDKGLMNAISMAPYKEMTINPQENRVSRLRFKITSQNINANVRCVLITEYTQSKEAKETTVCSDSEVNMTLSIDTKKITVKNLSDTDLILNEVELAAGKQES